METINQNIFLYINSFALQNNTLDTVAISVAQYMPYLFIFIEIYLYFIAKYKDEAMFAFSSMLVGMFLSKFIAMFYFHNRPFMDDLGVILENHAPDSSFPSDHTTFMFCIAWSLIYFQKTKQLGSILIILGFIGGFARVFEGVHYPFDIFGAIIISFISASIVYLFKDKLQPINTFISKVL